MTMTMRKLALATSAPRALRGPVRAQGNPADILGQLNAAFGDFKTRHEGEIRNINAALDDMAIRNAALGINGGGSHRPEDPEYTTTFADYFRKGGHGSEDAVKQANAQGHRAQVQAAMSVGSASDGGYLAPTEWDRRINKAMTAKSPMRRLAQIQPTDVNAYSTIWNNAAWGSGWVGETAARPETTTATLSPLTFASGEIYAMPAATQRLLDDAGVNVEDWLAGEVEQEFNKQEGIAFISGNGVNKPFGLLTYVTGGAAAAQHPGGVLDVVNSGHATTIPNTDILIDFTYGLAAPYRQNASWLMNSLTASAISKMKDGQGNYIWRESLIVGQPSVLLGRPVEIDENMPNIGAGALAVAFGDFRAGYLINDRMGTRILRDPYSAKPFVLFYTTKRVGAGVQDPRAVRLLKISA
ncbi:phage major capsid protein [Caulobacter sp. DWP3-1-3b2]|uniref:phage major capsid protein n=1 Tax=Caulobacter sp. DWP3-1-3b2 TaxID=2804643 RepID=UPI003CEEE2D5